MRGSTDDQKYNFGADVLRGVAILAVIAYHINGPIYGWALPWNGAWRDFSAPPSRPFFALYPATLGWAGVSLFFVLSGFCIHMSFLRAGEFSAAKFFWQRFWRIYPAYLAALVGFACLDWRELAGHGAAKQLLSYALLIHNFRSSTLFGINPSFWSIATEV